MPKRNVMASAAPYNLDSETIHLYLLLLLLLSYFAILLSVLLPPLAVSAGEWDGMDVCDGPIRH